MLEQRSLHGALGHGFWGQLLSGHMGFADEELSGVVEGREGISQGRWEVRLGLGWAQGNKENGQRVESCSWGRVERT